MARATMAELIQEVRALCDIGSSDYTAGTVAYWTDDQIQAILDQHRREIRYQAMNAVPDYTSGGGLTYRAYWTGLSSWEGSAVIQDSNYGTVSAVSYSFDATTGVCTFTSDQSGAIRLITGAVYNLHAAAGVIWTRKAAHYAAAYDTRTDNHVLSRSQLAAQANGMARTFMLMPPSWEHGQGNPGSGSLFAERGDM